MSSTQQLPKQIGRYLIKAQIGSGASADVYKAFDPHLERKLAIKVIKKANVLDEHQRKSFIQEGRILARLVHPGIVTIFDVGVYEKKLYIAMELMEGFTLEKVLKTLGKVTSHSLIEIALQLARALHYAHDAGILHRDIKPENIILLRDNKTVKLADFGISQLTKGANPLVRATDEITGTPTYMSPEQIRNQPMDQRSDLYSLGVLLYQLLAGRPPFDNANLGLLFNKIINDKPDLDILIQYIDQPECADEIVQVIKQLLTKEPAKRFQSASDLTISLQKISNKMAESKQTVSDELVESELDTETTVPFTKSFISSKQLIALIISILIVIVAVILLRPY